MSKIQEALKRLQQQGKSPKPTTVSTSVTGRHRLPETVIPIAKKKKVVVEGEKHHLSEEDLIRRGLLAPLDHAIPVADEFRRIKRPLIENAIGKTASAGEKMNLIMVASAMPGAGKTFCAVNLAASISLERELNVLLVDGDVAKPHISRAFGLEDRPGLTELLADDSMTLEDVLVRTDLNDIQVLPAGCRHTQSTELLASERMSDIMNELTTRYMDRIVVMDSPPLLVTSEAQAVAKQAGQIILIVEAGRTGHQQVAEMLEVLDRDKAINVILNKSNYTQPGGYYGGSYGYYGFNEEPEEDAGRDQAR